MTRLGRDEGHTAAARGAQAHTAGHIVYANRPEAAEPFACFGATLFSAGRPHGAPSENGSDPLATLRTWKNGFR